MIKDVEAHRANLEESIALAREAEKKARIELNQFNVLQQEKYDQTQRDQGLTRFRIDNKEFWHIMDLNTIEGKIMYVNKVASTWIKGYEGSGYDWILHLLEPLKEDTFKDYPKAVGVVPEYITVRKGDSSWGVKKLGWISSDDKHSITSFYSSGTPATIRTIGYGYDSCDEYNDSYNMGTVTTIEPATYEDAVEQAYKSAQMYVRQYDIDLTK